MGWFTKWRKRRRAHRALLDMATEGKLPKDLRSAPVVRMADGFMPLQVFHGGSLEHNLNACVWSYDCITQNAEAIGTLPVVVEKDTTGNGEWSRARRVPERLKRLIKQPLGVRAANAPQWSWGQLMEVVTQHCYLSGNAYLVPIDTSSFTALRLLMSPGTMEAEEDSRKYPIRYMYNSVTPYLPQDIVNIQNANPSSYWKGHSPLKLAEEEITTDKTAAERVRHNLRNRLGAGVVVMIDGYWGTDDEMKERILADLSKNYTESAKDGTPLVLGDATKLESMPDQGHGAEIFDTRRFSKRAIISVFKTPPPMIGEYDKATLNNFREAEKVWWKSALLPMARQIYEAINTQLVWPRLGDKYRIWFDVSQQDIGIALLRDRAEVAQVFVDMGVPTNDALREVGIKLSREIPELDKPLMVLDKAGRDTEENKTKKPEETPPVDEDEDDDDD